MAHHDVGGAGISESVLGISIAPVRGGSESFPEKPLDFFSGFCINTDGFEKAGGAAASDNVRGCSRDVRIRWRINEMISGDWNHLLTKDILRLKIYISLFGCEVSPYSALSFQSVLPNPIQFAIPDKPRCAVVFG